jgi:hypothetical protein
MCYANHEYPRHGLAGFGSTQALVPVWHWGLLVKACDEQLGLLLPQLVR